MSALDSVTVGLGRFAGQAGLAGEPALAPRLWLDGEITNRTRLAEDLGLDTNAPLPLVLAEGWLRWREGLPLRLDGSFALACEDADALWLYRDPSGLNNVYLQADAAERVVYGSDVSSTSWPGPMRLSRRGLHEYLRFGDIAAPNSLFAGIAALEPGQLLRVARDGAILNPERPSQPDESRSATPTFDDAVERCERLLTQAVSDCLADSAHPAAFLSGGVDSSLICALAGHLRPDLTATTVGFEEATLDESVRAAGIARHLGLRHEVLRFDLQQQRRAFDALALAAGQPTADPSTPLTVLALEATRERFDVLLDGTGADEALGLLPARHQRLAVQWPSRVPRGMLALLTRALRGIEPVSGYAAITDFDHPAEALIRWRGFRQDEISRLCAEPVDLRTTQFYRTFERFPANAHMARYSALLDAMPSERLNQATLTARRALRYPFCAREPNRFLRSLPANWRHAPGDPKRVLRTLLSRLVPTQLWAGPKHGFDAPTAALLDADRCALVREFVMEGPLVADGVLDGDRVRQYGRRWLDGDRSVAFRVWLLATLGAWLARHPRCR